MRAVFLMPDGVAARMVAAAESAGLLIHATPVATSEDLVAALREPCDLLLSFGTSVIVAPAELQKATLALNIHAGSPQFPGRDPHHFAIYREATSYGATMHFMTAKVDAGPIVDVGLFMVPDGSTPVDLLNRANQEGVELARRLFVSLRAGHRPQPNPELIWTARPTTRQDFWNLCRIDAAMPQSELRRRIRAAEMPGYRNVYTDIGGHRFRLEGLSK